MSLNQFHEKSWQRMYEAFAPAHSKIALAVCIQEESGELAAAILGVTGEKKRKSHLTKTDILDAVADCFTYLALLTYSLGQKDLDSMLPKTYQVHHDLRVASLFVNEAIGHVTEFLLADDSKSTLFWIEEVIKRLYEIAYTCGCIDVEKLVIDTFNMVSHRAGSQIFVL